MPHAPSPLVSPAWLMSRLDQPDLIILDATYRLPGEGRDAAADFRASHIPGARFFDIDHFADPAETSLPHMVPTPAAATRWLRALGLNAGSRVVIYDQKGLFSAPRGWFLLKLFGFDGASVLDGGLPGWIGAGGAVVSGEPAPPPEGDFAPRYRPRLLRGLGDMLDNLASQTELVLDARPQARFDATAPEPRPNTRGGHIPGSRSLPMSLLLTPDQRFKPVDELRRIFAAAGADGGRPVVTSCGSGVTAAALTFGMALAGLPIGALYDGSWSEWGSRPDCPIES